ncbi:MAG: HIT domain-containing protein, partial [Gemmatimonadetes bacterium]|nr:HIT domain-containing protein [Gemmatimonadota bacterium]
MEKLWATWRMPYIESVDKTEGGCIFCDKPNATSEEDSELILHRGAKSFVILNRFPYNPGHVMIAPYRHVGSFAELNDAERMEIMELLGRTESILMDRFSPDGINAGVNLGRAAGAGVLGHLHVHLVPRWTGDTNFMPVFGNVRVIPESLKDTGAKLRPHFEDGRD